MFDIEEEGDDWMQLCEQSNLIEEVFREGDKLRARKGSEFELRRLFDEAAQAVLADESTLELVERVLRGLTERNLPLPVVHFTSRAVQVSGTDCAGTGFVESIFQNGLKPVSSNVGAFVIRHGHQWKLAKPADLDPVAAMSQVLLFIFRYLKHGVRTNKDSLHGLREAGKGVPVMMVANPGLTDLRSGMDGVDHFVIVSALPPAAIIGAMAADHLSPDELACELFTLLDNWLREIRR
jgi:hypothetical protein